MASHFTIRAVYGMSTVRFFLTEMLKSILRKEFREKLNVGRFLHAWRLKSCLPAITLLPDVERRLSSRTCDQYRLKTCSASRFSLVRLRRNWLPHSSHCLSVSARNGCCTQLPNRAISTTLPHAKKGEAITIHFLNKDGEKTTVKGRTGQNLLDTVLDNDIDIDGYGACEGTLACSTCHLLFSDDFLNMLPKPSDEELDMLDLAYGQTDRSRLGCQVILTKEMNGMTVTVPEGIADARDA